MQEAVQRVLESSGIEVCVQYLDDFICKSAEGRSEAASAVHVPVPAAEGPEQESQYLFDACCIRASLAALLKETKNVREILQKAGDTSNDPTKTCMAMYVEATALLWRKSTRPSAKLKLEQALRIDSKFSLAHVGLGSTHYLNEEYLKAFTHFRLALVMMQELVPGIVRVLMGLCAFRLNKVEVAKKCLQRALQVDDQRSNITIFALVALARIFLEVREIPSLWDCITRIYQIAGPKDAIAAQRFADMLYFKAIHEGKIDDTAELILQVIHSGHSEDPLIIAYGKFQEGRIAHACGRLKEAKELLEAALEVAPDIQAIRIHLAKVCWSMGLPELCVGHLTEAHRVFPNEKTVLQMLCAAYDAMGHHDYAVRMGSQLTEAVAVGDPDSWVLDAWANRFSTFLMEDKLSTLTKLSEVLQRPADPCVTSNLAFLRRNVAKMEAMIVARFGVHQGMPDKTMEDIMRMIHDGSQDLRPRLDDIPLLYNYAIALEQKREDPISRAAARDVLILLVKCFPGFRGSYVRLCNIATNEGKPQEAFLWSSLLESVYPQDAQAAIIAGHAVLACGGHETQARRALARSQDQRSAPVALCLATLYLSSAQSPNAPPSHLQTAMDRFQYVLEVDPCNVLAAHGVACCVALQGDWTTATLLMDRVRDTEGMDQQAKHNVNLHMFNLLVQCGSYRQAIQLFNEHREEIHSQAKYALSTLAFCYANLGDWEAAKTVIEEAVKISPDDPIPLYNMCLILYSCVAEKMVVSPYVLENDAKDLRQRIRQAVEAGRKVKVLRFKENDAAAQRFLNAVLVWTKELLNDLHKKTTESRRETVMDAKAAERWKAVADHEKQARMDERHRMEELHAKERDEELDRARLRYEHGLRQQMLHEVEGAQQVDATATNIPENEGETESTGRKRARDEGVLFDDGPADPLYADVQPHENAHSLDWAPGEEIAPVAPATEIQLQMLLDGADVPSTLLVDPGAASQLQVPAVEPPAAAIQPEQQPPLST